MNEQIRQPKLRVLRDGNPITGEVWVVDENAHAVASFRIKTPQSHLAGTTIDNMDAGLNLECAQALVKHLEHVWSLNQYRNTAGGAAIELFGAPMPGPDTQRFWEREIMGTFTSEPDTSLRKLADDYHAECDRFDRELCPGAFDEYGMLIDSFLIPSNGWHEMNRHAMETKRHILREAAALGFNERQVQDAINNHRKQC